MSSALSSATNNHTNTHPPPAHIGRQSRRSNQLSAQSSEDRSCHQLCVWTRMRTGLYKCNQSFNMIFHYLNYGSSSVRLYRSRLLRGRCDLQRFDWISKAIYWQQCANWHIAGAAYHTTPTTFMVPPCTCSVCTELKRMVLKTYVVCRMHAASPANSTEVYTSLAACYRLPLPFHLSGANQIEFCSALETH